MEVRNLDDENVTEIDLIDRKIIALLRSNATISQSTIAKTLGLSRPTVQKRLKSLINKKVILGTRIIINEKKLGKGITAFILVELDRARRTWEFTYDEILSRMQELEILEFHHVTGNEDVILKMRTRNIDSLEYNLIKITQIKGVAHTRTMICLSSVEEGDVRTSIEDSSEMPPPKDILWNFT